MAASVSADEVIFPYRATYTVQLGSFEVGTMKQSLHYDGRSRLVLETTMSTTGPMSWFKDDTVYERTVWAEDEGEMKSIEYRYHFDGRGEKVREWVRFDWNEGAYKAFFDGKKISRPLPQGVYDKLLYQVAMRHELDNGKKALQYRVVNKDKIDLLKMQVIGSEPITTPFGKFNTVKIRKGSTIIWCAPELGYLPVQLQKEENGVTATSYILSLERR